MTPAATIEAIADARAAVTRATAARWHWITERWHEDGDYSGLRGTPTPERYHWARETLLDGVRAVRGAPLPGYTGPARYVAEGR